MPSEIVFLETSEPLARQVATFLLKEQMSLPIDLGDTQVWVPTAGAARRIRESLAVLAHEKITGVLSPVFIQPMQALLPLEGKVATRSEREAAWVSVLRQMDETDWGALLPDPALLDSATGALGVAGMLCDLCDLLAEGGLSPAHPLLGKICSEDAERWQQLQFIHRAYRQCLKAYDLADPNELRLQPQPHPGIRRMVVACIPDLAEVTVKFLEELARSGVIVSILIWKPADLPGEWDAWGRPIPEKWANCQLNLAASQIRVARQADEEATRALDFLAAAEIPGNYALALADETLGTTLASEITRREGVAFLPEGRKLANEEPAIIALQWENWQSSGDLRVLRNLLQLPHFHRWLALEAKLFPSQLLAACDSLITNPLCETLAQAVEFLASAQDSPENCPSPDTIAFISALEKIRQISFTTILECAWANSPVDSEATIRVLELWAEISFSPLFARWPEGRLPAFSRALRTENIFTGAPKDSVELSGWLETPWMEASRIAICGCVEGRLPVSVEGHPFLPDSKRAALGLQNNAQRLARDAYIMSCLLARHTPENLQFSFSRFDVENSPALPSRLLMRTPSDALPKRVLQLFATPSTSLIQPNRQNGWRWNLPEKWRVIPKPKISPTQCKDYLACPMRFYWKDILRLDIYDPDPREMDARRFGLIIHKAVEMFGRRAPDEARASLIEKIVLEEFQIEAVNQFGPSPTAAVRVQLESAQVRLRAFARVQADEYAAGWRILEVEKRIAPDADSPLKIGPLNLSAQVDRIESHPDFGLRILDYKTFSKAKPPEKTHFATGRPDHFLPQSQVTDGNKEKTWTELQLPLYRYIASQLYELPNNSTNIQTAYFLLTADPAETQIVPFDLDDATYQSALECAEEIARRIAAGIFWPPQAQPANWEDAYGGLFSNGSPENCFDVDTISFLKGQR